jgi:thymidylate kinase
MFTVSLIGPDGVGKTTVAKRVEALFPYPIKSIYMGLNISEANYSLPTTRLWHTAVRPRLMKDGQLDPRGRRKRQHTSYSTRIPFYRCPDIIVRKTLGLSHELLEEWYRYLIAWIYEKRGYIVILDRHFLYDFFNFNGHRRDPIYEWKRKIHNFVLQLTVPEPELVICLDAPSEVIFKRKNEFDLDEIEIKREQYLQVGSLVKNFTIINANQNLDSVVSDVIDRIARFQKAIN